MPSLIRNTISFSNISIESANEILKTIRKDGVGEYPIDFNKLIPMPYHIRIAELEVIKDWKINNWGCEVNPRSFFFYDDDNYKIVEFKTDNKNVTKVASALSEMYPDVLISYKWNDEYSFGNDVGNVEYRGGQIVSENIPQSGSKEALIIAASIYGQSIEEFGYRLTEDGTSYEYVDDDVIEQPDEKIKVVLVKPMQKPQVVKIGSSLESMQATVGGCIEQIMPFDEEVALVCNEDGKNDELPLNRALKNSDGKIVDIIVGDFFICSAKGENFTSLTDEQVKRYSEMFKNPERFQQTSFGIKAIPVIPKNKSYER